MARTPSGLEVLEQARKQIAEACTVDELRYAQAVKLTISVTRNRNTSSCPLK
jgi:hypothetical protein